MKTVTLRHALLLAVALAAATLTSCAAVHQNPASSAVTEQAAADAPASQADAQSPTNVPF